MGSGPITLGRARRIEILLAIPSGLWQSSFSLKCPGDFALKERTIYADGKTIPNGGQIDSRATGARSANPSRDIELLISGVRSRISAQAADLLPLFDIYAQEARFARAVFQSSLSGLPRSAKILEIGAGTMLLSAQLQHEGFQVTALEPVGEGFSHFTRLQKSVLEYAGEQGIAPALLASTGESLDRANEFDFACSMNVMEHVRDVTTVIERAIAAVRPGAAYRFVCPNYAFPYETHFNIPILWNKPVTRRLLRRRIENCRALGVSRCGMEFIELDHRFQSPKLIRQAPRYNAGIQPRYI